MFYNINSKIKQKLIVKTHSNLFLPLPSSSYIMWTQRKSLMSYEIHCHQYFISYLVLFCDLMFYDDAIFLYNNNNRVVTDYFCNVERCPISGCYLLFSGLVNKLSILSKINSISLNILWRKKGFQHNILVVQHIIYTPSLYYLCSRGRRGRDRMVVVFTTTYAFSAYLESRSLGCVQHYVIQFVSDLRQVGGFLRVLQFPPLITLLSIKCYFF